MQQSLLMVLLEGMHSLLCFACRLFNIMGNALNILYVTIVTIHGIHFKLQITIKSLSITNHMLVSSL